MLKPNGRLCIIPVVLTEPTGVNHTDPSVWATKYVNAPEDPEFDDAFPVVLGEHGQRLMKFYTVSDLDNRLRDTGLRFTLYTLANCKRGNSFALLGTK